jgi:prevent-host-death family protein
MTPTLLRTLVSVGLRTRNRRLSPGAAAATQRSLNGFDKIAILASMKKASITEAKNNLSALIDSVKGGSPVLIVDRGRPVARLEPVSRMSSHDDDRLARLVRVGVVRPARGSTPKALIATKPPRPKKGASGVRVLLEERREGR